MRYAVYLYGDANLWIEKAWWQRLWRARYELNQWPLLFPHSYIFKLPKELSAAVSADLAGIEEVGEHEWTLQDLGKLDLGGLSDDTQAGIDDLVAEVVMKPFNRSKVLAEMLDEGESERPPCELCKEIEQVKTLEEYMKLQKARNVWAAIRLRFRPFTGPDEYMCRNCGADVLVHHRDDDTVEVTVEVRRIVE